MNAGPSVVLLADTGCRIPWRFDPLVVVQLIICRVANPSGLWETACMTNQQQCFQHREDYKVQKLVERIEAKLALRAKANREAVPASPRN